MKTFLYVHCARTGDLVFSQRNPSHWQLSLWRTLGFAVTEITEG